MFESYAFVRVVRVGRGIWVLGRVGCVFVDSYGVEGTTVAFIKEELVTFTNDHDIPGIYGSRSTHEDAEDDIGTVDRCDFFCSKLLRPINPN